MATASLCAATTMTTTTTTTTRVFSRSTASSRPARAHRVVGSRANPKRRTTLAAATEEDSTSSYIPGHRSALAGEIHRYEAKEEYSRFDSLDAHREKFTNAYAYDVKTKVAAPARYRVKLPRGYDSKREKPYSALICVPGEAGFGPRDGKTSLMTSVSKKRWNDDHDVVIVELGFNTPTWLNDSSSVNHESYLLKVVLPHFLAAHNIGRMSLLGYGSGAQGALSLLARMPTTFDSVVAADAPVLGGFKSAVHEWGAEDLNRGANWGSWNIAFPKDEDFDAYDVANLVNDPWVRDQLNYEAPRIAIIPGKKTVNELGDFTRLLDDAGVQHDVVSGFENEDIGREGDWIDAALNWLAPKMIA